MLNYGEAHYGDAPVLGKTYDTGYEPLSGGLSYALEVGRIQCRNRSTEEGAAGTTATQPVPTEVTARSQSAAIR